MKRIKKICVLFMLITLLSNYVSIMGDVSNYVAAETLEFLANESNNESVEEGVENDIVRVNSILDSSSRYKGVLLANTVLSEKNKFKFSNNLEINVKDYEKINFITITDDNKIINDDSSEIDLINDVNYKVISVDENEFSYLIGSGGSIQIIDGVNDEIARIDSSVDPINGEYKLIFVDGIKNIKIIVNGIKTNGMINIKLEKELDSEKTFSREMIEKFSSIKITNRFEINTKEASVNENELQIEPSIIPENSLVMDENKTSTENTEIVEDDTGVENLKTTDSKVKLEFDNDEEVDKEIQQEDTSNSLVVPQEKEDIKQHLELEDDKKEVDSKNTNSLDLEENNTLFDIINAQKIELNSEKITVESDNTASVEELMVEKEIVLEESETKADLKMSKVLIETQEENEVSFDIMLKSNGEKYDIFKNPIFEIELPETFEEVEIESVDLSYKNGLLIDSWKVVEEAGKKLIQIRLSGVQNDYNIGTVVDGTVVTIDTNVKVNRLVTSKVGVIKLRYTNELASNLYYEKNGLDAQEYEFKYNSPKGLIKEVEMSGVSPSKEVVYNENKMVCKTDVNTTEKIAKVDVKLVNNYESEIENMIIIGKIPYINAVDKNGYSYGTNIDAKLHEEILTEGLIAKVMYSEEENTEIDSEVWKETVDDISKVKEFKILIENDLIKQGDTIAFSYSLDIPANLNYNDKIIGENEIKFTLNGGEIVDNIIVGVETEEKENTIEDLEKVNIVKQDVVTLENKIIEETTEAPVISDVIESSNLDEKEDSIKEVVPDITLGDDEKSTTDDDLFDDESKELEIISSTEEDKTESDESREEIEDNYQEIDNKTIEKQVNLDERNLNNVFTVGTQVEIGGRALKDGEDVQERQILDYTVIIRNTSNNPIKDLSIKAKAHNANLFYFKTVNRFDEQSLKNVDVGRFEEDTDGKHEFEEFKKELLNPGEEFKIQYTTIVNGLEKISEKEKTTFGEIEIEAEGIEKTQLTTVKNNVVDGNIEARVFRGDYASVDRQEVYTEDQLMLLGVVKNNSSHDMENVWLDFILPQSIEYNEFTSLVNEETTIVTKDTPKGCVVSVLVETLNSGEEKFVTLITKTVSLDVTLKEMNCDVGLRVRTSNEEYVANNYRVTITQRRTEFIEKLVSNKMESEELKDGEEIQYTYTIKNVGVIEKENRITDRFGDALVADSVYIEKEDGSTEEIPLKQDGESDDEKSFEYILKLQPQEEATITMNTHVSLKDLNVVSGVIEHKVLSDYDSQESIKLNKLFIPDNIEEISDKPIIFLDEVEENGIEEEFNEDEEIYAETKDADNAVEEDENEKVVLLDEVENYTVIHKDGEELKDYTLNEEYSGLPLNISNIKKEIGNGTFVIRGRLFEDVSKDGLYNDSDKGISNKKICLFDVQKNGIIARTYSNERGEYQFDVESGRKYIVMFEYDKDEYEIVKRGDTSVQETCSFVISTIQMEDTYYGLTDVCLITDSNETLNMGLIKRDRVYFDVSSYISEISVKNGKTYKFDKEDQITDIEIHKLSKNADVTAKLNVLVKNTGNALGFFEQIKVGIPKEWSVDEEKNPEWTLDNDGNAYYSGLNVKSIEPGNEEEVVLTIGKKLNKKSNEIVTQVDLEKTYAEDDEIAVNEETTELKFKIRNENTIKTIITEVFVCTTIYMLLLVFLVKNKEKLGKEKYTKVRRILRIAFIVSLTGIFVMNTKQYSNGKVTSGDIDAEEYSTGYTSGVVYADPSDGSYSNLNTGKPYGNITSFMGGNRTGLLDSKRVYERKKHASCHTRTFQCMHGTSISTNISDDIELPSYFYRAAAIVDFGYNNGSTNKIWTAFGSTKTNWKKGANNSSYNAGNAQFLAYMGYYFDNGLYTTSGLSGAITITNAWSRLLFHNGGGCCDTVNGAIIGSNMGFIGPPDDYGILATGVLSELVNFYNDNRNRFSLSAANMGTDTVRAVKVVDAKVENATGDFYGPIKFKVPKGGKGGNIGNSVTMTYTVEGGTAQSISTIYTAANDSSGKNLSYMIDNDCSGSGIYVKLPNLNGKAVIKIRNSYSYYQGRFMYLFQGKRYDGNNQNKGIVRGCKTSTSNTIQYEVEPIRIDIAKSVHQICNNGSNVTYAENGCDIEYKITLSCRGCGPAKNITFVDNAANGNLVYKSIRANSNFKRNDNGSFTYTGEIQKGRSVDVYVTYTLNTNNNKDSNKAITNTVTINKAYYGSKLVYDRSAGISKISSQSVLTASATCYMRMYEAKINKWVEKVISADGTVVNYGSRKNNTVSERNSNPVYVEPGDQVIFGIALKNTGSGDSYGNFKTESIKEYYEDNYLTYGSVAASTTNNYTNPVDTSTPATYGSEEGTVAEGKVERRNNSDGTHKYVYIDENNVEHDMEKIEYTLEQYTYWFYKVDDEIIAEYSEETPQFGDGGFVDGTDSDDDVPSSSDRITITDANGREFTRETVHVASGSGGGNLAEGTDFEINEYILITDSDGNQYVESEAGTNIKRYTKCTYVPGTDYVGPQIEIFYTEYYDGLENIPSPEPEGGDPDNPDNPDNPENPENPDNSGGTGKLPMWYTNAGGRRYASQEEIGEIEENIESGNLTGNEDELLQEIGASQEQIYSYGGQMPKGREYTCYYTYTVKVQNAPTGKIYCKAKINGLTQHHDKTIYSSPNLIKSSSVTESGDYIIIKGYKASINKKIVKIESSVINEVDYDTENRNKNTVLYGETGDYITFRIDITNTGTTPNYGNIISPSFYDTFDGTELEYVEYKDVAATSYTVNGNSGRWSRNNYTFTYSSSLAPQASAGIYIKFKVKKLSSTPVDIVNTATFGFMNNKNYVRIFEEEHDNQSRINHLESGSVITSSDQFTLRIYEAQVIKDIVSIDGEMVSTQEDLTGELGDIVVYKITVKNTGKKDTHGKLHYIRLADLFETDQLEYQGIDTSYETQGWEEIAAEGNETVAFKNSSGIAVTKEKSFYIKMLVVYRSVVDNQWIVNTASIRNISTHDNVLNRNKIEIVSVLNGTLTDDAMFRYLTYHVDFRKYMDTNVKVDGKDRMDLTNREKYDNPIEHEKGETDAYVLRLKDTGETKIHDIEIDDILEEGLTFIKGADGSYIKDAVLQKTNGMAISIKDQLNIEIDDTNRIYFNIAPTIEPGEVVIVKLNVSVEKSNLYLWNIQNVADIKGVKNKHDIQLILPGSDILVRDVYSNKEFIRMKDLVVSGTVWKDLNKDGVMDVSEPRIPNITVNLVDTVNNKKAVTKTDANGKYTFTQTNGINLSNGSNGGTPMILSDGRAVKATNKDVVNGNYYHPGIYDTYKDSDKLSTISEYIPYYVEFEYNGARYISTNNYACDNNLNKTDYSMEEAYHTDSNAAEYHGMREEFEKRVETVNYNNTVSSSGTSSRLKYDKEGHISTIIDDVSPSGNPILKMLAYSFAINPESKTNIKQTSDIREVPVNDDSGDIKYLWLNRKNGGTDNYCYTGETDYLKEINLGLKVQEFDLTLEKDVFEVRSTVNGEATVYDYNQGNNGAKNPQYIGNYATGGVETGSTFTTVDYKFRIYSSDYNYRAEQYENAEVRAYKANTELDMEVVYKITIRNDKTDNTDDREHLYAVVNEITDYYPTDFVKYNSSNNTKVQKLYNRNANITDDMLTSYNRNITEAYYYDNDDTGEGIHYLTLSNESNHKIQYGGVEATDNSLANQNKSFAGYNKLYITGLENIVLDWNESQNIYIRYTLDKNAAKNNNLRIDNGTSVSEINSYSTYENKVAGKGTDPAGYIDINSNPGNVGYNAALNVFDNLLNFREYENDTYRTGIKMEVDTPDNGINPPDPDNPTPKALNVHERIITGIVWDDARTNSVGSGGNKQYLGDGELDNSKSKDNSARKNPKFDRTNSTVYRAANKRFNDLLEEKDNPISGVRIKLVELVIIGDNIYEETINPSSISETITISGNDGKFKLQGFIPGQYIVRYDYGYETTNSDVRAAMLIYNGQDYKSTKFNPGLDSVEIKSTANVNSTAGDLVLDELVSTSGQKSDARDDSIRRLEANGYSEYINNDKSNVLQVSKLTNEKRAERGTANVIRDEQLILEKTNMFADTPTFPIRIENDKYQQTEVHHTFDNHQELMYTIKRFTLNGIDFGIEYRPEADIDINKFIKEVKLSNHDKVLLDLKFDSQYANGENSRIVGTSLNKSTSVGVANAQMVSMNREKSLKGFMYLNVEDELMQGLSVEISYVLNVNNISEVDRVSSELRLLRYQSSAPAGMADIEHTGYRPTLSDGSEGEEATQYRALMTARNILDADFNIETRAHNSKVRNKNKVRTSDGYYGKYLGNTYYTGNITGIYGNADVVAEMKLYGILDYVDNDLVFESERNSGENNYWRETTSSELRERGMVDKDIFFSKNDQGTTVNVNTLGVNTIGGRILQMLMLLDNKGRSYDNGEGNSRLALAIDDGKEEPATDLTKNKSLSRYLPPEVSDSANSAARININTYKLISSGTDARDMEYDNIAEVVEYRTETGRVTTVASHSTKSTNGRLGSDVNTFEFNPERSTWITVGDANLNEMENDFYGDSRSKTDEPDTAISDMEIRIGPPTGRLGWAFYLRQYSEIINTTKIVLITAICTSVIILFGKKITRRKRIYK